jgi:hypothetical protein
MKLQKDYGYSFKSEINLNNIQQFISYLKENTLHPSFLLLFGEVIPVYSENNMKPTNTIRGKNINAKAGGTQNL